MTQTCEHCGDGIAMRRTRCKRCGFLVCSWCYHHVHSLHIANFNPPACAATTCQEVAAQRNTIEKASKS